MHRRSQIQIIMTIGKHLKATVQVTILDRVAIIQVFHNLNSFHRNVGQALIPDMTKIVILNNLYTMVKVEP